MSKPLLSLCRIPALATRDGNTGGNAHLYLPFYGHWFASGQIYPFVSTILQDKSRILGGTKMIDNYQKDCCCCGIGSTPLPAASTGIDLKQ